MLSADLDRSRSRECCVLPDTRFRDTSTTPETAGSRCLRRPSAYRAPAAARARPHTRPAPRCPDASKRNAAETATGMPGRSSNTTAQDQPCARVAAGCWLNSEWSFREKLFCVRVCSCLRLQFAASKRHVRAAHVRADKLDNVIHCRAWLEDRRHAKFLERIDILIRNDPAYQYKNVVHLVVFEEVHHAWHDGIVGA